jgi:hypothetical protein
MQTATVVFVEDRDHIDPPEQRIDPVVRDHQGVLAVGVVESFPHTIGL